MSVFHQISKKNGRIDRVPKGTRPIIEFDLREGQYVTSVSLEEINPYGWAEIERKTQDWRWTAFVVTPL